MSNLRHKSRCPPPKNSRAVRLVSVLLLCRDNITMTIIIKERFDWALFTGPEVYCIVFKTWSLTACSMRGAGVGPESSTSQSTDTGEKDTGPGLGS